MRAAQMNSSFAIDLFIEEARGIGVVEAAAGLGLEHFPFMLDRIRMS